MNSEPSSSSLKRKYDAFSDSTPSASCPRKYDVFLSFRGEDTRKGFVSHLYDALDRRGVYTYIDKKQLDKGTTIAPELVKAIEESRSAIVVLSTNYASSTWCLEELCHILKCCQEKDNNYKVFPLFCYVEPTDVRNRTGDFGEGYDKNREVIEDKNISKIEKWKKALPEIAARSGWELKFDDNQTEAELIKIIVKDVSAAVPPNIDLSIVSQDYVGMDVRLEEVNQLLDLSSDAVRTIGIWGMGGIGKTTIAQLIFEQFKDKFEASCFVQNVRETLLRNGSSYLQEYLLKCLLGSSEIIQSSINGRITLMSRLGSRRVLIVLDDVKELQQIEDLIGTGDNRHSWFGEGSRIIVTTRDKHLLKTIGVDDIYEVSQLSISESRQLLFQKAFKKNSREEYSDAIKGIVGYANGHPLGLDVLGSSSIERSSIGAFEGVVRYFNGHPLGFDIFGSLSIEKNLIGAFEGIVRYANGHPLALKVLGSSLYEENVKEINVNRWMNTLDQLKQYPDQEILGSLKLSFDGLNEPEKEIFLDIACFSEYTYDDSHVTEMLRSFRSCWDMSINNLESKSLIRTRNVRAQRNIKMHDLVSEMGKHIVKLESPRNSGKRSRVCGFNDVSEVLTDNLGTDAVELIGCSGYQPLRWTVDSLLKMRNLKCLISQYANIEFLNDEPRKSSTVLKKLVVVDLTGSKFICNSINFRIIPNLQRLYLSYCRNLRELDQSVESLKKLVHLDLSNSDIKCLPSNIESLEQLVHLNLSNSNIKCLPSNIGNLSKLKELNLSSCSRLQLLNSLSRFRSLVILDLSDCGLGDRAIHDEISSLSSLKELNLSGNYFTSIPGSISKLFQLTRLDLNYCNNLVCLPKHLPLSLEILNTDGCDLLARYLPIWNLDNREQVPLMRCRISEDEYKIPRNKGSIKCFPFEESEGMLLKIIWSLEIPESCVKTGNIPEEPKYCVKTENIPKGPESCVKTENILKGYTYELCVVYEVFGIDDGYSTLESTHVRKDFLCNFETDQDSLKLKFDILIRKRVGFYVLLMFIPGEWFGDQLNRASVLRPSVDSSDHSVDSSDHLHVRLKGFNGQFITDRSTFFNEVFSDMMESHNLDLVMCNDVLHWWRMLGLSDNSRSILLQQINSCNQPLVSLVEAEKNRLSKNMYFNYYNFVFLRTCLFLIIIILFFFCINNL